MTDHLILGVLLTMLLAVVVFITLHEPPNDGGLCA